MAYCWNCYNAIQADFNRHSCVTGNVVCIPVQSGSESEYEEEEQQAVFIPPQSAAKVRWPLPTSRAGLATNGHGLTLQHSGLGFALAGWGVFATRPFAKGEYLTFYDGPLITNKDELEKRNKNGDNSHMRSVVSLRVVIDGIKGADVVESQKTGQGMGSCINDGRHRFSPNVKFVSNQNDEVYIKAIKPIAVGEEVFINYGQPYWTKVKQMERQAALLQDDTDKEEAVVARHTVDEKTRNAYTDFAVARGMPAPITENGFIWFHPKNQPP